MEISPEESSTFISTYKIPLILGAVSIFLLIFGLRLLIFPMANNKIEFIDNASGSPQTTQNIKVDIEGAIEKPGVYSLAFDSRIGDLLLISGGLSVDADRVYVEKNINLAARLSDGAKIFIPKAGENVLGNTSNNIININSASKTELDTLVGIGEVTAQKIIDNRPYSAIEELLSKKVVSQNVYEKIKEKIGVY